MYAAIGYGGITASRVANRLRDEHKNALAERKTVLDRVSAAAERRISVENFWGQTPR
jgi:hypothetical protein